MKQLIALFIVVSISLGSLKAQEEVTSYLIPQPGYLKTGTSTFNLKKGLSVSLPKAEAHAALITVFAKQLSETLKMPVNPSKGAKKNTISFALNANLSGELGEEGYQLDINKERILITAAQAKGWFYGWQTLIQLVRLNLQNNQFHLQEVLIKDQPKFEWRGLMVDVSRHFFTKDVIKRYIDQMAKYKFNVLHLHLTDNQGWRLEIKRLPKLTEVSAWRVPRTGYWKDMPAPENGEAATYGGFYSQEDIKEIVAFANSRFLDVVPEIDLPGHSLALIAAYPELSCTKTPQQVLAGDPWNPTRTNVVCVGNDLVYTYLDQIFTEVAAIFPSKYIHIGGDEVSRDYWSKCEACQNKIKTEGLKNVSELQSYFINRLAKLIKSKGKTPIGWYENLEGQYDKDIVLMSWKDEKGAVKSSNEDKKVILTPAFFTYLDFYQGDPFLENAPFTVNRLSYSYKFDPLPKGIKAAHVLGGQGSLWTEQVPNERKLQFMTWPRGLALAENLWSTQTKAPWPNFVRKLEAQLPLLDLDSTNYSKYFYDPMAIAAKGDDGSLQLRLETEVPDLKIHYSFDDTDPDYFYPLYPSQPIVVPKGAKNIRMISYRGATAKSRIVRLPIAELKKRAKL